MTEPINQAAAALEHGPVMVLRWRRADQTVLYASKNLEQKLGVEHARLVSGELDFETLVHPQDRARCNARWAEIAAIPEVEHSLGDFRLVRPDGQVVEVAGTARISGEGEAQIATTWWTDITQRKTEQRAHDEVRERLEMVIEGTRLGMWDWNPQTNEVTFNERWANMLGHPLKEVPFELESWSSRVHPDDMDGAVADLTAHMEGKTTFYENVHRMKHKDGTWRYILDRGRVMERDEAGQVIRFSGTHTDITREKEAELEARAAVRAKSLFMATMSHEIRTPLHGILGLIQLLLSQADEPEQREYLQLIRRSGDTLLVLINDLLDFSKMEERALELERIPFDLIQRLKDVVGLYRERANNRGIRLNLAIAPEVPRQIKGDAHRLGQVLSNLLSNAIKFTHEGEVGVLASVRVVGERSLLQIEVRDTGRGIEDLDRIWETFTQEEASITRQYGGTGLGLAIVKQIVEAHGGTVGVRSTPGVGSTFTVEFEIEACEAPEGTKVQAESLAIKPLAPLRILVAEDNAVNQIIIRGMLKPWGQTCDLVETGLKAVEACQRATYDLILMDLHMPELDGIEATERIRALVGDGPLICGLSADAYEETRQLCMDAGMCAFLPKPFEWDDLADIFKLADAKRARPDAPSTVSP